MNIVVIGSFMMDLVVRTFRAPAAGETIIGSGFNRFPGGKGANQAVAAARLGGKVTMAGMLGRDDFGSEMLHVMRKENIATECIRLHEAPTGIGSIVLEESGENRIIVVPGANLKYSPSDLAEIEDVIRGASILVMQLEMDLTMTEQAVAMARKHGVPVILNPAPAVPLSDALLRNVAYLTPNETEAGILTGKPVHTAADAEKAAQELRSKGVRCVIVTLAAQGALIVDENGTKHVPGYPVRPVDTVAAGDSFNGALAVQLVSGARVEDAVRFANAVGALTVTREGAIPSLPFLAEVEDFINRHRAVS
ncbi:ribokinase [Paenibacillus sp. MBLB4367]|uniref:ribokinase n=1 Tax=Paenibacillus sp. MBLB4367 TaxID=3384767 RepID=UPI0039081E0E